MNESMHVDSERKSVVASQLVQLIIKMEHC